MNPRRVSTLLAAGLLVIGLLGACAAPVDDVAARGDAIVDGTLERGRPEVVFLYRLDGAACTGAIISPRVVLTANHCVEARSGGPAPASNFRIYVGSSVRSLTAEYRVSQVRPVPNAGLNGRQANDVALLILATPAAETPMELSRDAASTLWGDTVTAVGFGQTPSGGSGTKFTTTTNVERVQGGFVFVQPAVCQGDSGGPLIGPDGRVYGVASFIFSPDGRTEPQCGTAPGAYNAIEQHLAFIDGVLEETGTCVGEAEEACNGEDDDCDEVVDEGCTAIGEPCAESSECVGGLCEDTPVGRLCTSVCDPLRPAQGCGPGFYCAGSGCTGHCVPGETGALAPGSGCEADTDCQTLFCRDPGDGRQRCLEPCEGDEGLCLADEVCTGGPGACGACVAADIVVGRRGLGEPCETDGECRDDMVCHDNAGVLACASACEGADDCPERFECREGLCILDQRQGVGGVCASNADCGDGICAAQGERRWCTAPCESADECPDGFDCVDAGGARVCAPASGLEGDSCTENADCVSNLCANTGSDGPICTSFCDARTPCAPGFQCLYTGDGSAAVCIPASVGETDGGDCSVSPGGGSGPLAALGVLAALGLIAWRRRR
ncbi:MAG TPA: S1 family peptidase [Sandaracinaceae bacterium LLY-WYZ-13_1]|nr:S1 family peptidase [Sandaracinaceae bacterium LLY-WYZ-13_1]